MPLNILLVDCWSSNLRSAYVVSLLLPYRSHMQVIQCICFTSNSRWSFGRTFSLLVTIAPQFVCYAVHSPSFRPSHARFVGCAAPQALCVSSSLLDPFIRLISQNLGRTRSNVWTLSRFMSRFSCFGCLWSPLTDGCRFCEFRFNSWTLSLLSGVFFLHIW